MSSLGKLTRATGPVSCGRQSWAGVVTVPSPGLEGQELLSGDLPRAATEIAVNHSVAERLNLGIGDSLELNTEIREPDSNWDEAGTTIEHELTVVGTLTDPSGLIGMGNTAMVTAAAQAGWVEEAGLTGDRAVLYTRTPAGVVRSPTWSVAPAYLGTGMLKSSASDLARYLSFMAAGEGAELGLTPELMTELTLPRAWSQPGGAYALGWSVRPHAGVSVVRHGGSLKGVSTCQGFVPELGLGVAVLMNLDGAPAMRSWYGAINLALGMAPDTPVYGTDHEPLWAAPGSAATELGRYAGVYSSGEPWGRLELVAEPSSAGSDGGVRSDEEDEGRYLFAYSGDDQERIGRLALLERTRGSDAGTLEFAIVGEKGAWDGGRFHIDADGRPFAVQHAQRWYDREET